MAYDNLDFDDDLDKTSEAPPEETGNRTFLVIAGVLGAIAVLALVSIAAYAMMILPGQRSARESYQATLNVQNTEVANIINMTSTAAVQAATMQAITPTAALPTNTPTTAPTSVVAIIVQKTATPTIRWEMATATVLNATIMANAEQYSATSTAKAVMVTPVIPDTGFADDVGLPALFGMSLLLAGVIFVARRLRTA